MAAGSLVKFEASRSVADVAGWIRVDAGCVEVVARPNTSPVLELETVANVGTFGQPVRPLFEISDGDLVVSFPDAQKSGVSGVQAVLLVPSDRSLAVRTASADIKMESGTDDGGARQCWSEVRLETGSGKVLVTNVSDQLSIRTGSGDVEIVDGDPGRERRLRIRTGSGHIALSNVQGSVVTATVSGDVFLRRVWAATGSDVSISTGSGFVTIEDHDASATVRTESGDVAVGFRVPSDGAKQSLDIKAGSGCVSVQNAAGSLNVSTHSGDVKVLLRPGAADDTLGKIRTGSGHCTITVPVDALVRVSTRTTGLVDDRLTEKKPPSDGRNVATEKVLYVQSSTGDIQINPL